MGVSAPSLHIESTDSMIHALYINVTIYAYYKTKISPDSISMKLSMLHVLISNKNVLTTLTVKGAILLSLYSLIVMILISLENSPGLTFVSA